MLLRFECAGTMNTVEVDAKTVANSKETILKEVLNIVVDNPDVYFLVLKEDTALIELLEEVGVSYKVTSYATANEKARVEEDLKKLQTPSERLFMLLGKLRTNKIFQSDPDKVYDTMINCVNDRMGELLDITDGEENTATDRLQDALDDVETVIDNTEEKHGKLCGIKSMIGKALKLIAGVVIGVAKFSVKLLGCTGLIAIRTAKTFCSEVKSAFGSMSSQYRKGKETLNQEYC